MSRWISGPQYSDLIPEDSDWETVYASGERYIFGGPYLNERKIENPSLTPVAADGLWPSCAPIETDLPPLNFYTGLGSDSDMEIVAIPRHGSHPNPVPTNWPRNRSLPGAVNVGFYDGHCELVKLDRLWQLNWHKKWQAPAKRPGLP